MLGLFLSGSVSGMDNNTATATQLVSNVVGVTVALFTAVSFRYDQTKIFLFDKKIVFVPYRHSFYICFSLVAVDC